MKDNFLQYSLPQHIINTLDKMGISKPTPIQTKSFSPILSGKDTIDIAQTNTRKTLAYLLFLLKEYKFSKTNQPKILVLIPTYELVIQIIEILEKLTEKMMVKVLEIYGSGTFHERTEKKKPWIYIKKKEIIQQNLIGFPITTTKSSGDFYE